MKSIYIPQATMKPFMDRNVACKILKMRAAEAEQLEKSMSGAKSGNRGNLVVQYSEFANGRGHVYARIEECGAILQVVNYQGKPIAVGDRNVTREQVLATVLKVFW